MSYNTEDAIITGSGRYDGVYTLSEISWGDDNDITNKCTERILGEKPMVRFNFPQYNRLLFLKSLVKWPLPEEINEENINKLPKRLGEILFKVVRKLNTVNDKERRDFLQTSDRENTWTEQQENS